MNSLMGQFAIAILQGKQTNKDIWHQLKVIIVRKVTSKAIKSFNDPESLGEEFMKPKE